MIAISKPLTTMASNPLLNRWLPRPRHISLISQIEIDAAKTVHMDYHKTQDQQTKIKLLVGAVTNLSKAR
jgi:hypothetical protein